jgi:hypothetical protein
VEVGVEKHPIEVAGGRRASSVRGRRLARACACGRGGRDAGEEEEPAAARG